MENGQARELEAAGQAEEARDTGRVRSPGYPDVTSRGPYRPYPLHSKIDHKICIKVVNFPSWTLGLSGSFQLVLQDIYIYNIII